MKSEDVRKTARDALMVSIVQFVLSVSVTFLIELDEGLKKLIYTKYKETLWSLSFLLLVLIIFFSYSPRTVLTKPFIRNFLLITTSALNCLLLASFVKESDHVMCPVTLIACMGLATLVLMFIFVLQSYFTVQGAGLLVINYVVQIIAAITLIFYFKINSYWFAWPFSGVALSTFSIAGAIRFMALSFRKDRPLEDWASIVLTPYSHVMKRLIAFIRRTKRKLHEEYF